VAILVVGSVLLGALFGRFYNVWILLPACALVLAAVLVRSAVGEHGLLLPLLEFTMLSATLQIGYVLGLASIIHSQHLSQRRGKLARARPLPRH